MNTISEYPYIHLEYKYNDKSINYKVCLVDIPSNLGKGVLWYFVCPKTGNRCRKLYLADTYFCHRSACRVCMNEKQTQSKKTRHFDKLFGKVFQYDQIFEQLCKKHIKKQYACKQTRKYLRLTQKLKILNVFTFQDLEKKL